MLFESFIYPYFEKDTLSAISDLRLWTNLYHYLENCCHIIEHKLKSNRMHSSIPYETEIFSWNEVAPGRDDKKLLRLLKEIFNLKNTDSSNIKRNDDNNTITVKIGGSSLAPIKLMLDNGREKVIVGSTIDNDQHKEFEYDITEMGTEIMVVKPTSYEEWLRT